MDFKADSTPKEAVVNTKMREMLSAFIDGESSQFESRCLLAELDKNPILRSSWSRYQVIGQVMRGQPISSAGFDISSQVMSAIEDEAMIEDEEVSSETSERRLSGFWHGLGRFSIAASVAALVVWLGPNADGEFGASSSTNFASVEPNVSVMHRLEQQSEVAQPDYPSRLVGARTVSALGTPAAAQPPLLTLDQVRELEQVLEHNIAVRMYMKEMGQPAAMNAQDESQKIIGLHLMSGDSVIK